MKRPIVPFAVASGLAVVAATQILPTAAPQAAEMQMKPPVNVEDIKWGPAPPAIPPGAPLAVVAGDPGKEGLFTMRLKMPANYKVPAHHHPTDEFVTVISGDFRVGLGDKLDMDKGQSLKAGGFGDSDGTCGDDCCQCTVSGCSCPRFAPNQLRSDGG